VLLSGAALLDGLFEQPAVCSLVALCVRTIEGLACHRKYSSGYFSPAALLGRRRVSARWCREGEKDDRFELSAFSFVWSNQYYWHYFSALSVASVFEN
jgi:hypothetical protein